MEWVTSPEIWISLFTLTILEIVLGIDNIVFISILAGKLPQEQQRKARRTGLGLALITRVLLLCGLAWMVKLTAPLFEVLGHGVSGRDLILIAGGLFLLYKATHEIHGKLEGEDGSVTSKLAPAFAAVILQILVLDLVFSLDSVITAVGMVEDLWVMVTAMLLAVGVMMFAAGPIARFVDRRPTVKVLALAFLILIGVLLVAEGLGQHVDKGYIYFAMAFAVGVELVNMRLRKASVTGEHPGMAQDG